MTKWLKIPRVAFPKPRELENLTSGEIDPWDSKQLVMAWEGLFKEKHTSVFATLLQGPTQDIWLKYNTLILA